MNIKFYVVFHYNLENFYTEDLKKYFEFISVNDNIQKNIKAENVEIIKESTLKGYKDFQSLKYNESSAMINLETTILDSDVEYLCFLQYDNMVNNKYIEFIKQNITETNCICPWLMGFEDIMKSSLQNMFPYFQKIVDLFNTSYEKSFTIYDVGGPMISTFVIHKNIYLEMIDFYRKSEDIIINEYIRNYGTRHIAGFLERFWAIFLKLKLGEDIIKNDDGFLSHTDVKDYENQMWRYQN